MSKKLISFGLLLVLVWPVNALDLGTSSGIPGKDLSKFGVIGNPEQDIIVIPGYESPKQLQPQRRRTRHS